MLCPVVTRITCQKRHEIDFVSSRDFSSRNGKKMTVHFSLLKRHYLIIVCLENIYFQLADMYIKGTIQIKSWEKQLESLGVVRRNRKERTIGKVVILLSRWTWEQQVQTKTISFVVLALPNYVKKNIKYSRIFRFQYFPNFLDNLEVNFGQKAYCKNLLPSLTYLNVWRNV